jgi:hypothetical protein
VSDRSETLIDSGLEYTPGEAVRVWLVRREERVSVSDRGAAVERAGRPRGFQEVCRRVAAELVVNVDRNGVVELPVVKAGPGERAIVQRIADASLALYEELLDLQSA